MTRTIERVLGRLLPPTGQHRAAPGRPPAPPAARPPADDTVRLPRLPADPPLGRPYVLITAGWRPPPGPATP